MSLFSFEHSPQTESQPVAVPSAGDTATLRTARVLREVLLRWSSPGPEQIPLLPSPSGASPATQPLVRDAAPAAPAPAYDTRPIRAALVVLTATVALGTIYITLAGSLDTALGIFRSAVCILFPPSSVWHRVCAA